MEASRTHEGQARLYRGQGQEHQQAGRHRRGEVGGGIAHEPLQRQVAAGEKREEERSRRVDDYCEAADERDQRRQLGEGDGTRADRQAAEHHRVAAVGKQRVQYQDRHQADRGHRVADEVQLVGHRPHRQLHVAHPGTVAPR